MQFVLERDKLENIKADCEAILVIDKDLKHKWIQDKKDLDKFGFKGEEDEVCFLAHQDRIYTQASFKHEDLRLATARIISSIKKTKYKSLKIGLYIDKSIKDSIKAMVEGFILGSYSFDKYKSKKDEMKLNRIIFALENYNGKSDLDDDLIVKAIKNAKVIGESVNFTRDIVNSMPDELTPKKLAKIAKELAKESSLECIIEDEKFLQANGMNAFYAVSKASAHKPRLIHLIYKPKDSKGIIALVGKGLTYDSGGLSLKPGSSMVTMKADKSGASAVLGVMRAISEIGSDYEIHAVLGATENMIGGNAYKPDDVLVAKNGVSIEIRNTDAEGRLVLADCLCYIQEKVKVDYIVDIATLTGACVVALGEYTTGIMGHSLHLKHKMLKASERAGELTGSLPFNKYLKKSIKSSVADISNISSSRYGGAITAALFLDNFIFEENKDKWIHLDIAGPAYVESSWGYNQSGASGAGVRLLLSWIEELSKGE
jgi:leucyl aminopeptidase